MESVGLCTCHYTDDPNSAQATEFRQSGSLELFTWNCRPPLCCECGAIAFLHSRRLQILVEPVEGALLQVALVRRAPG